MKNKKQTLFMRLQDDEESARASCGCILRLSPKSGMNGAEEFLMCPMHEHAPQLLAFLKESHQPEIDAKHYGDKTCSYCTLIAKVTGKPS